MSAKTIGLLNVIHEANLPTYREKDVCKRVLGPRTSALPQVESADL